MKLFPAIDILNGRAVRLLYGKKELVTDYGLPLDRAKLWRDAGADFLHVVDLCGAFEGESRIDGEIEKIAALGVKVQSGGGLRTMEDAMLGQKGTQQKLERMRCDAAAQLKREDVLRQLARLAFGRVDDAVTLALRRGETEPEGLELSAVSELRVTEKGVEVKLVDRVRALETLWKLLEASEPQQADPLLQALAALPGETGDWNEK